MKAAVAVILLVSVGLMLIITIGGWSKLQGLKPINILWCIIYVIIAFYVFGRWSRGLLPIAAALAILLLILAVIAGTGVSGTSWFDRNNVGFAAPQTPFGGKGLDPNMLGVLTVALVPVQAVLILFAMRAFAQAWNVELEVPKEEAEKKGYKYLSPPGKPAPA
jgi:signal transduction histidine kinase